MSRNIGADTETVSQVVRELLDIFPLGEALREHANNPDEYDALETLLSQLGREGSVDMNQLLAQLPNEAARERTRRRVAVVGMIRAYHRASGA